MRLQLSEKNRKRPSFGASGKKMYVLDGKTWGFGRMLGHSVSDLQLEQTLYALWMTNNTKTGQVRNRERKRKRGNAHKPHVSPLYNGYSYRENEEIHSDSSSNSDEKDGNENENDLVTSSNTSLFLTIIQPS